MVFIHYTGQELRQKIFEAGPSHPTQVKLRKFITEHRLPAKTVENAPWVVKQYLADPKYRNSDEIADLGRTVEWTANTLLATMIKDRWLARVFQTKFGWEDGFKNSKGIATIANVQFFSDKKGLHVKMEYPIFMIENPVKRKQENPELARLLDYRIFHSILATARRKVNEVKNNCAAVGNPYTHVGGTIFEHKFIGLVRIPDRAILNDPAGKRPPFIVVVTEHITIPEFIKKFDGVLKGFGQALDNFKKGIGYP